jgi:hypothetical protein
VDSEARPDEQFVTDLPKIGDDFGGSIERRFMADSVEKVGR